MKVRSTSLHATRRRIPGILNEWITERNETPIIMYLARSPVTAQLPILSIEKTRVEAPVQCLPAFIGLSNGVQQSIWDAKETCDSASNWQLLFRVNRQHTGQGRGSWWTARDTRDTRKCGDEKRESLKTRERLVIKSEREGKDERHERASRTINNEQREKRENLKLNWKKNTFNSEL